MIWTWWMTLLVIFAVLLLIGCIPIGVEAKQDAEGLAVRLKIWFLKLQLVPKKPGRKPKKKKKKKAKKKLKESVPAAQTPTEAAPAKPAAKKKKFTLKGNGELIEIGVDTLFGLLDLLSDTLGNLRRKIRLNELMLHLTVDGKDPVKASVSYGRAWAAIGALVPRLEQLFVIKKRDIQPILDYNNRGMKVEGRLTMTITVGRVFRLVMRAVGRALALGAKSGLRYLKWKKKKAKKNSDNLKKAVQTNESSSV